MKCPVCHGKKFVWKDKDGKVVHIEFAVEAQLDVCDYCLGAGEASCCDGPVCTGNDEAEKND